MTLVMKQLIARNVHTFRTSLSMHIFSFHPPPPLLTIYAVAAHGASATVSAKQQPIVP